MQTRLTIRSQTHCKMFELGATLTSGSLRVSICWCPELFRVAQKCGGSPRLLMTHRSLCPLGPSLAPPSPLLPPVPSLPHPDVAGKAGWLVKCWGDISDLMSPWAGDVQRSTCTLGEGGPGAAGPSGAGQVSEGARSGCVPWLVQRCPLGRCKPQRCDARC